MTSISFITISFEFDLPKWRYAGVIPLMSLVWRLLIIKKKGAVNRTLRSQIHSKGKGLSNCNINPPDSSTLIFQLITITPFIHQTKFIPRHHSLNPSCPDQSIHSQKSQSKYSTIHHPKFSKENSIPTKALHNQYLLQIIEEIGKEDCLLNRDAFMFDNWWQSSERLIFFLKAESLGERRSDCSVFTTSFSLVIGEDGG